jgi:hypothetical protein
MLLNLTAPIVALNDCWVSIAADVGCPIVLDVDIPSAKKIYCLLAWWAVGELAGKLEPVLLHKVRFVIFLLELIRIRPAFLRVRCAVVIVRVLVVSVTEFGGRCVRGVLNAVDLAQLVGIAMWMGQHQLDAAKITVLVMLTARVIPREVV